MAGITALFDPSKSSGYQATSANITNPFNSPDVNVARAGVQTANNQTQGALSQQDMLVNALQNQNGIGNQSNVYGQQQQLADVLSQRAIGGGGPSVAQTQLNQTTGQNVANQAALMAGQRGAGANVGLEGRQIAQQGANTQQQAAGQAATLRAQEMLANTQALQNQQGALANTAGSQVANQMGATQTLNQLAQANQGLALQNQGQILGAQQGYTGQQLANTTQQNAANAGVANTNAGAANSFASGLIGGGLQGAGSAIGSSGLSGIGTALLAEGGPVYANSSNSQADMKEKYGKGPRSKVGRHFAEGGRIDMRTGGGVPGKPKVGGAKDSYSNDTVPAMLSPGEIVLPRSVTKSSDPKDAAAKFVQAIMSKKGK